MHVRLGPRRKKTIGNLLYGKGKSRGRYVDRYTVTTKELMQKRHNEELYCLYEKPKINVWSGREPRPRRKWKDTAETGTKRMDENAKLDWILDREKRRGLLVAAQVPNGSLNCREEEGSSTSKMDILNVYSIQNVNIREKQNYGST